MRLTIDTGDPVLDTIMLALVALCVYLVVRGIGR